MGRPCVPVALLIGLSILKEMYDCSDERLIEELYFNTMRQKYPGCRRAGCYPLRPLNHREKAATARRKKEQQAPEFKEAYKIRSGIEATNSELNRAYGAKKVWTRGFNRVNLAMAFKVMALNIRRFSRYATEQIRLKASEIGNLGESYVQNTT
jgi:hypothetical protein